MVDALKGIVVAALIVFVFAVYPAYRDSGKIDDLTERAANAALTEFVDTVRSKGYIDVRDYKTFLKKLDSTSGVFDVKMEYYKKVIQPNYDNPTDFNTFKETFNVRYDGYYTKQILDILYPQNSLPDDDESRQFKMHVGDLFNVRIESKGSTIASGIGSFLFHNLNVPIVLKYGGMVRFEAP